MAETNTGTVPAEPPKAAEPAKPAAPATPAEDIDALFKEFEEGTKQPAAPVAPAAPVRPVAPVEALAREVEAIRAKLNGEEMNTAVKKSIDVMRERDPRLKGHSDKIIRAAMTAEAGEDPRIWDAFVNRDKNPQFWGKIQSSLAKKVAEELSPKVPDENLTDARDSARRLVGGQFTTQPAQGIKSNEELSKMSDAELDRYAKSLERGQAA